VQLCLHYLVNQEDRIRLVSSGADIPHRDDISASPRMIAFVDVPPETMFLPQAAELDDGRVVTFFDPLVKKLQQDGDTSPVAYPDSTSTAEGRLQRDAHWKWYATTGTSIRQSRPRRRPSAQAAGPGGSTTAWSSPPEKSCTFM
jgi:hypothetical protein